MSSQSWKSAIRHNYVALTDYLNVDEVLPRLYQQDVLTQNEYEEFKVITETRVKKTDRLLQKLLSKTFTSYEKFVQVLQDTTEGTAHNELISLLQNYRCGPTQPVYQSPIPNYSSPVPESEAHKQATAKEVSHDKTTSISGAIYEMPLQESTAINEDMRGGEVEKDGSKSRGGEVEKDGSKSSKSDSIKPK